MVATCSRIYVACLASYNAGTLHGRWIDADQDADAIREEIAAMLRESPCPTAEEYAIHDFEGFEGIKIGEHEDIETVAELARAIDEHGEAFAAWWNNENRSEVDIDAFQDAYAGTYKSKADYAEELTEELGYLSNIPGFIKFHIDYDGIANDMRLNGDAWFHEGAEGVHVFRNY